MIIIKWDLARVIRIQIADHKGWPSYTCYTVPLEPEYKRVRQNFFKHCTMHVNYETISFHVCYYFCIKGIIK